MRRYRRNDALQPPESAYSPEAWEQIAEFAASGAEALPVDIPMPEPDSHGRAPALVYRVAVAYDQRNANVTGGWDPYGRSEDSPYFIAYVYPREALDSRQHWYELRNLPDSSVWLVGFQHLRTPQQRDLWDSTVGRRRPRTGGLPVAESYLVRGNSEEARRAVVTLRRATMAWMEGEGEAVLESGAYDVEGTETYVAVSGRGDDLAAYDGEVRVLRDQVFGLYWAARSLRETDILEVYGPYTRLDHAQESAKEQRIAHDDRTDYERSRNMSGDAVAAARNERTQEEQERASRQELSLERDVRGETIALVYKPRSRTVPSPARILSVVAISTRRTVIQFGEKNFGEGYLDTEDIEGCARTHTPSGVIRHHRGTGYGLSLYTSLATIAYQGYEMECIGSSPTSRAYGSRSEDADEWWAAQLSRGLANEGDCNGCAYIRLEDLVDAGLIVWMAYPGAYEGALADAREKYLEAFLSAEPDPEQDSIELIDQVLSAHASAEAMAEWRAAHREEAEPPAVATANRRRAGRRPPRLAPGRAGKPSFVTPALEAHVDQQYAWLQE